MKTSLLRPLSALLFAAIAAPFARAASDSAAELLARNGAIPLKQAGPYVEPGTLRVQVEAKLGRPDLTLNDGTWLYQNRHVGESTATGTLVVRFTGGRVSSLTLATPAVIAALRADKPANADRQFAANK
jgi:hypothetical protein